jgi:ATPase subunit of ABC transporter with duplicated ATPase domains
MIAVSQVSLAFGSRLLFDDVSFNLNKGHRYALVGGNGCGKSTFLKILAGTLEPSLGEVSIPAVCKVGWLKQDHFSYEQDKIIHAVIRGNNALWEAFHEKEVLLEANVWTEETGNRLGELEETIARLDGYTAEMLATKLLIGLGIPEAKHHEPLSILSGGYKLRVLLAQALFNQPDILLLDEPTNHLDIMSIAWLEDYLKSSYKGLLVFISHDQQFLENVATDILDIDYGEIRHYPGSYAHFQEEKVLAIEHKEKNRKNAEKKRQQLQTFVDRFKAKASLARQAQSKLKMIDRIEVPDIEQTSRRYPTFHFTQKRPSGKDVVVVRHATKAFGDKVVFQDVGFTLRRGDKAVIIGHNGIGKSTLLKCMMGIHGLDHGSVTWGHEVHTYYFAQDHHDQLQDKGTVIDWLEHNVSGDSLPQVRGALGAALFTHDDVFKPLTALSGGEGGRLLLAKMLVDKANLMILDEPTNHLDLEAIESLQKGVNQYEGTLLFVSHDRYFVRGIATRVLAFTEKGLLDYPGSYDDFIRDHGHDYLNQVWQKEHTPKMGR